MLARVTVKSGCCHLVLWIWASSLFLNFPLKGWNLFVVQRNDSSSPFCVIVPTVNALIISVGKRSRYYYNSTRYINPNLNTEEVTSAVIGV